MSGDIETGDCENLATCGFFRKYYLVNREACRAFIRDYCRGSLRDTCERKAFRKAHGSAPSDDLLPNGVQLPQ